MRNFGYKDTDRLCINHRITGNTQVEVRIRLFVHQIICTLDEANAKETLG